MVGPPLSSRFTSESMPVGKLCKRPILSRPFFFWVRVDTSAAHGKARVQAPRYRADAGHPTQQAKQSPKSTTCTSPVVRAWFFYCIFIQGHRLCVRVGVLHVLWHVPWLRPHAAPLARNRGFFPGQLDVFVLQRSIPSNG